MVQHNTIDHSGVMSYASNANSTSAANYGGAAPTVSRGDHIHLSTGGSGIPETLIDAAGDLIQGSAADTAARLAIGAAGTILGSTGTAAAWQGAYASHTPTLTAATTNPTLGSGSSATGRYSQIGKHVHYYGQITFGSSGVNAGSGEYWISLPVNASTAITNAKVMGSVLLYDSTSGTPFLVALGYYSTTSVFRIALSALATLTASDAAPWTWAASDAIIFDLNYEAA